MRLHYAARDPLRRRAIRFVVLLIFAGLGIGCGRPDTTVRPADTMRLIIDTDANNELDDQHALAYALLNPDVFDLEGITINRTRNGGDIRAHAAEAERVVRLCDRWGDVPVIEGASGSFEEIVDSVHGDEFDGSDAVRFIIERAEAAPERPLVVLAIGKLTNIALALERAPHVADRVRIVWLGSNYPDPGEYNLENDIHSLRYLLDAPVQLEMALVRYGSATGTDAVRVTPEEIRSRMPGRGPLVRPPVVGRNGGSFSTFGDYSVSLFDGIALYGDPPSRALFDMAAVAILKNASWASAAEIPAPQFVEGQWRERAGNSRKIKIWDRFDREAILADFFRTFDGGG